MSGISDLNSWMDVEGFGDQAITTVEIVCVHIIGQAGVCQFCDVSLSWAFESCSFIDVSIYSRSLVLER